MNIKLYLRDVGKEKGTLATETNEHPICVYITWNSERLRFSTKIKIAPKQWNANKEQIRGNSIEIDILNQRLRNIKSAAETIYNDYLIKSEVLTPLKLKEELMSAIFPGKSTKTESAKDLFQYLKHFVADNPRNLKKSTIKSYNQLIDIFTDYSKKTGRSNLSFAAVDAQWAEKFSKYLYSTRTHSINSVDKHIKNIKALMRHSLVAKLHNNRDFEFIQRRREESKDIYISEPELKKLIGLDVQEEYQLSKDILVFSCLTGLRISDVLALRAHNWKGKYIEIMTQKTSDKLQIPLRPTAQAILKKYGGQFPKTYEQKYNKEIKHIASQLPEFQKQEIVYSSNGNKRTEKTTPRYMLVKSHIGRRSFATNAYLEGTDLLLIRNVTGHKTEKDFFNYIKVNQVQKAKSLQEIFNSREY